MVLKNVKLDVAVSMDKELSGGRCQVMERRLFVISETSLFPRGNDDIEKENHKEYLPEMTLTSFKAARGDQQLSHDVTKPKSIEDDMTDLVDMLRSRRISNPQVGKNCRFVSKIIGSVQDR